MWRGNGIRRICWRQLGDKTENERRKAKNMYKTKSYAAGSSKSALATAVIPRRHPTERDVQIEILFCGICHSDLHYARDEWHDVMPTVYPCVPGHEIVGQVTKVGSAVSKFKEGDIVGVGCL